MKTPTDLALAALNGFKWLGNNLHNIRSMPDQFESFYKAALDDAEKAIAALTPPKPAWQLPAPPAGQRWHREDFTEADLPEGWRPLLMGEGRQSGDELWYFPTEGDNRAWCSFGSEDQHTMSDTIVRNTSSKTRTRRPLPSAPKAEPWDSPEDVPVPVCYLRRKDNRLRFGWAMVTGANTWGFTMLGRRFGDLETVEPIRTSWSQIGDFEHSTDRKEWKPCTKEAKA